MAKKSFDVFNAWAGLFVDCRPINFKMLLLMCVLFPCIPQMIGSVGRSLLVYNATNAFITFVQSETDLHIQNHTALQKPKNNINNKRHFTKKGRPKPDEPENYLALP